MVELLDTCTWPDSQRLRCLRHPYSTDKRLFLELKAFLGFAKQKRLLWWEDRAWKRREPHTSWAWLSFFSSTSFQGYYRKDRIIRVFGDQQSSKPTICLHFSNSPATDYPQQEQQQVLMVFTRKTPHLDSRRLHLMTAADTWDDNKAKFFITFP